METNETENKKTKECLITFTRLNKYFIFPFLCPIICFVCNYIVNLINEIVEFKNKPFLLSSFIELTYIGAGLIYFIDWIRNQTEKTRENSIIYKGRENRCNSIRLIYNEGLKINKFRASLIIFILSALFAVFNLCQVYSLTKNTFEVRLYFLFFIPIFSKCILKEDIFKHHILSLIIGSIGLILLFFPIILMIEKEDIIINIILFITSIGFSLHLVLIKHIMTFYYISPYLILLFIGIISILLNTIGFTIYSLIKYNDFSIFIDNFDFKNVEDKLRLNIYFSIDFILGSILQNLSNLVVYYFSPILLMVTDSISPMLLWAILILPQEQNKINIIFNILGYLISLFSSLIYNEIIIFNFCDFNLNTKKCIEERQKTELISLRVTESENKTENLNESENEKEKDDSSFYDDDDEEKEEEKEEEEKPH